MFRKFKAAMTNMASAVLWKVGCRSSCEAVRVAAMAAVASMRRRWCRTADIYATLLAAMFFLMHLPCASLFGACWMCFCEQEERGLAVDFEISTTFSSSIPTIFPPTTISCQTSDRWALSACGIAWCMGSNREWRILPTSPLRTTPTILAGVDHLKTAARSSPVLSKI